MDFFLMLSVLFFSSVKHFFQKILPFYFQTLIFWLFNPYP